MQTEKVQAWQVDPGDSILLGGDVFNVADKSDETEAITFYGYWEDEAQQKEISRHPYDEIEVIVSFDDD